MADCRDLVHAPSFATDVNADVKGLMKSLCKYMFLVVCIVLVSSCASSSRKTQAQSEALNAQMDSDFDAYMNCMKAAAIHYSASTATPHEIADAAQSKCGAEFRAFETSIENHLKFGLVTERGVSTARRSARETAQELQGSAKNKVVQWVIDIRFQKK